MGTININVSMGNVEKRKFVVGLSGKAAQTNNKNSYPELA